MTSLSEDHSDQEAPAPAARSHEKPARHGPGPGGRGHQATSREDAGQEVPGHDGPAPPPPAVACARCGDPADGPPPTWTCSVENGVRRYFCDACSREHLRSIEGRLDSAWW
ncbi:hypothetical protein [Streptomyces sennicomposti]